MREDLIRNTSQHDIRMVYLACHHILKNRGHFLIDGDIGEAKNLKNICENFEALFNDISEYECRFAANFAQGKIGRAKTIVESTEFAHLKQDVMHVIKNAKEMSSAEIMSVVKDITNYKLTIDDYLDLMAMWFRDVLLFKSTNDTNYLIFSDEISLIKSQAQIMSYEGIQDILNSIDKVRIRLKANVNFDLCIELLIMAMKEAM